MGEHELWNELGNLYFMSGAYNQAIHAYTRSIALDKSYGRPYSNMALAYVQKGRYGEAIVLYQHGIKLLSSDREKAFSWYKLGNVYRMLREYRLAMDAYRQADALTSDLSLGDESNNEADLLLNRRPIAGEMLQLMMDDDTVSQGTDEQSRTASSESLEPNPLIEELTPWWFDDQVVPEDESPSFYDMYPWEVLEPVGVDNGIVNTEPLQWNIASIRGPDMVNSDSQENGQDDKKVTHYRASNSDTVKQMELETINSLDVDVSNDIHVDIQPSALEVEKAGVDKEPDSILTAELEAEVDKEPDSILTAEPEMEAVTAAPEFGTQDLTNSEAVQYEAPTELSVVELKPQELSEIQIDIDKFKRVLEVNPRNAFAWDTLGGLYKSIGKYEDALEAYQKTVSIDSSKAFYFHHLGLVYAAVGRHDDAIAAFERVIEIDPNHCLAHATLGGYYRKNGNHELAQRHIEKARELISMDENEYNHACMESICGNSDRALELLEIALKSNQTYVNWARRDPDLDFIRNEPRFQTLLAEYSM